MYIKSTNN